MMIMRMMVMEIMIMRTMIMMIMRTMMTRSCQSLPLTMVAWTNISRAFTACLQRDKSRIYFF